MRRHVSRRSFARITASLRADLSEFRLWVPFGQPVAESVHDGQSNDENADADEDLRSAMCCLGANLTGRGKSENDGERPKGVVEPVFLVLPERQYQRYGGQSADGPGRQPNE